MNTTLIILPGLITSLSGLSEGCAKYEILRLFVAVVNFSLLTLLTYFAVCKIRA